MQIVEVKQNWPADRLLFNWSVHNTCNYKCWYCFPGSNEGTYRWPDFDLAVKNFNHLINYYKTHLNKKFFEVHLLGGEPTLWPKLGKFIETLKKEHGNSVIICMTTNGSRTLAWWKRYGQFFDKVLISVHPETADEYHIADVCDFLYDANVFVDATVLMDPNKWDRCIEIISGLKTSKRRWSIQTSQVIHDSITYTKEQHKYLKHYLKRWPNILWMLRTKKNHNYGNTITFKNGKTKKIRKNYLLINKANYFNGWECNVGIDNISVLASGRLSASCEQRLYGLDFDYNFYDPAFVDKFAPTLKTAICDRHGCFCEHEFNTSKREINNTKKVIHIHANRS